MTSVSATSARARERIRRAATTEFQERGYTATTMDHIRMTAGLSRGGLYYQYGSTEEILFDLLAQEQSQDAAHHGASGLAGFLEEQRIALSDIDNTLRPAVYEYLLGLDPARRREILQNRFREAAEAVSALLPGTLDDAQRGYRARHIVRRLEGLSLAAMAGALDRGDLDTELGALTQLAETP